MPRLFNLSASEQLECSTCGDLHEVTAYMNKQTEEDAKRYFAQECAEAAARLGWRNGQCPDCAMEVAAS
jgi:hypothetical protein